MNHSYSFLKITTNQLIERGKCLFDIGLWNGKMGLAVYLLHLARITKNEDYDIEAHELIDTIYEQLSYNISFHFGDGLLGIGCGFEYIISNGFIEGNSDEVLSDIDQIARTIINSRSMDLLDIEKGVCGVGYYLYYRLKNKPDNDDSITTLKLKEYLIYLIDWIEELLIKTKEKQEYNDSYFLLCRLQKLNVYNHKVEKLITFCLQKIVDFNCRLCDNYELLGINSLKALKPWM